DFSIANWIGGNFAFDEGVSFSENCLLSTEINKLDNNSFIVYPNPTNGIVYFSEQINIEVYNSVGQILFNRKNTTALDLSVQPTGVYFISFISENGQIVQRSKIIKE